MLGDHLQDKMKFYGNPSCLRSAMCLFTAAEKGVDLDSHYVDPNGGAGSAEVQALAPHGLLPALKDVDFVVCGQEGIMSYLNDKGFGPSLSPRNGVVRAIMYQWNQLATNNAMPAVSGIMAGGGDAAAASACFDLLNSHLASKSNPALRGDFICGGFSFADVHWAAMAQGCMLADSSDIVESRPAVAKWWGLVKSHPSTSKENIRAYDVLPTKTDISGNSLRDVQINV
ncbi:MAG: glutathione S-transferase family protein [Gammaproteobacteria bacterium]|nr:glutathione S-transferase family protein [Gammaproteobacteria bacterium]